MKTRNKVIRAYKLMKVDASGRLHFPFADTDRIVRLGEWMEAQDVSTIENGVRKTTLKFRGGGKGRMAPRPGFHCGDSPYAPHIGIGGTQKQRRYLGDEDVWVECVLVADIDYQAEANRNGTNKRGHVVAKKADIRDHVPVNGFYRYKTNPMMQGTWLIGGTMRLERIMGDEEVLAISMENGFKPMPRKSGSRPLSWTNMLNKINAKARCV